MLLLQILKESAIEWDRDNVSRLAAALAYYAVFSLAPLLVIAIAVAGFLFGEDAARGQLRTQLEGLMGPAGAQAIQTMVESAARPGQGIVATVVGLLTLFLGATGVFGQLQGGLNTVWEVSSKPGRVIKGMLRTRMLSFGLVVGIGFLLLVSLLLSAALEAFNAYARSSLPEPPLIGWGFVNAAGSFLLITLLFAMIYKVLPDVIIPWRDVWLGAGVTSLLFTLGKYLIGLYLGNSSIGSAYGAAGTLVILLIWIYYSAQIFYFGAEVTQVYAKRCGSPIQPAHYALRYVRIPVVVADVQAASVEDIAREQVRAALAASSRTDGEGGGAAGTAKFELGAPESTLPGDPLDQQARADEDA